MKARGNGLFVYCTVLDGLLCNPKDTHLANVLLLPGVLKVDH